MTNCEIFSSLFFLCYSVRMKNIKVKESIKRCIIAHGETNGRSSQHIPTIN